MIRSGLSAWACLLLFAACTFERRPEAPNDEVPIEAQSEDDAVDEPRPTDVASAARAAVRLFRESVASGDLSLALGLLHSDAVLVDDLVGDVPEELTRGERLLELRREVADRVVLEPVESEVLLQGEESALVTTVLIMREEAEEGAGEMGRLYESVLLVPSDEGWRIRHLHRSFLPLTEDPS